MVDNGKDRVPALSSQWQRHRAGETRMRHRTPPNRGSDTGIARRSATTFVWGEVAVMTGSRSLASYLS
jgi:hypothetical protein